MLFGDKTAARSRAREVGVPVLPGTPGGTSLEAARAFLGEHGAVMVKAVAGGGGRGMRPVTREQDLAEAMRRCASEAAASFGDGSLYVEQLLPLARHVEVQVIGDGTGAIAVLGDRDCSIELAARERLPVVMFAEGGGGRPGDTDTTAVAQLEVPTFRLAAQLSGKVPRVAVVTGYCFAGNAALGERVRPDRRDRGCEPRHGRSGHDRGRRARGRAAGRGRADVGSGSQRRRRRAGRGRGGRGGRGPALPAVRLGFRAELDAIADPQARRARYEKLVAEYTPGARP